MVLAVIFLGGGLGSVARYLLGGFIQTRSHSGFPFGTLGVNLLGCIAIGLIARYFLHSQTQLLSRTALVVGFCGGFTTFSTFSQETFALVTGGKWTLAATYVGLSVVLCLVGTMVGFAVGPSLNR